MLKLVLNRSRLVLMKFMAVPCCLHTMLPYRCGGGGILNDYSLFICGDGRYSSASESDRAYIKDWLEINACTNSIIIGDLVDAYYGV